MTDDLVNEIYVDLVLPHILLLTQGAHFLQVKLRDFRDVAVVKICYCRTYSVYLFG